MNTEAENRYLIFVVESWGLEYRYLKNSSFCDGVELLGLESYRQLISEQIVAFSNRNILVIPKYIHVFNRAVKKGAIYNGRSTP